MSQQHLDDPANPEQPSPEQLKRRYRWQCRRGASEVEVVLNDYLDRYFIADNAQDQARFARVLDCADVDLLDWFTQRSQPENPELRAYVQRMIRRVAEKG